MFNFVDNLSLLLLTIIIRSTLNYVFSGLYHIYHIPFSFFHEPGKSFKLLSIFSLAAAACGVLKRWRTKVRA